MLTLLCALLLTAEPAQTKPVPAPAEAKIVSAAELLQRPPQVTWEKVGRAWVVERGPRVGALLVELTGPLPLHQHPDGDHRIYLIEGELLLVLGDKRQLMHPGDYWVIPHGVKHRLEPQGGKRVLYGSVDTPPVDARQTVWLEPAPKVVPPEPAR